MNLADREIQSFSRRVVTFAFLRSWLRVSALWLFLLGIAVLLSRSFGQLSDSLVHSYWWVLITGLLIASVFAGWRAAKRRPDSAAVRAMYDLYNRCGGVVMASAELPLGNWAQSTPTTGRTPPLRWQGGRTLGLLGAAIVFFSITLLLPDRFTQLLAQQPLDVAAEVKQIVQQIEILKEHGLLTEDKAKALIDETRKLEKEAAGSNPAKTWEALDHLKQSNQNLAKQAAQENVAEAKALAAAEAIGKAVDHLPAEKKGGDTAKELMKEMGKLGDDAGLEEGMLKNPALAELLEQLKGGNIDPEKLKGLLKDLAKEQQALKEMLKELCEGGMIGPEMLGPFEPGMNMEELERFLAAEGFNPDQIAEEIARMMAGRGGVNRGPGKAPLFLGAPSNEDNVKFKEEKLPLTGSIKDSKLLQITKTAPEVTGDNANVTTGSLNSSTAGGGAAQSHRLLPAHRPAIQRYFKREP